MLIKIETGLPWEPSQPIGDVRYPLNIEQLWTDAELAALGLARSILEEPEAAPPDPAD
jgi:hypothetical protein